MVSLQEEVTVQALLTPEMGPGQCLPLRDGTSGHVDIRLHHPIYLTGFPDHAQPHCHERSAL